MAEAEDNDYSFMPPGVSERFVPFSNDFPPDFDMPRRLKYVRADTIEVVNDWHFAMMNDKARNEAYRRAIEKLVTKDDIVVEIGAGSGILSIMAAKAGAKHVYAIEGSEHFVEIARENAKINGVEDKVTVIHGMSTQVQLPEKATVLLGEILGTMLDGESATTYYYDAKKRLCTRDAKVIPHSGVQYATLIESEKLRSLTEVEDSNLKLSEFNRFRDSASVIKSKLLGATLRSIEFNEVSDKMAVYSVNWNEGTDTCEDTKVCDVKAKQSGGVTAIMYWWQVDMDGEGENTISTHPHAEDASLMRDVQWGQGITLAENPDSWDEERPKMLQVTEGDDISVQFDLFGFEINGRIVSNQDLE